MVRSRLAIAALGAACSAIACSFLLDEGYTTPEGPAGEAGADVDAREEPPDAPPPFNLGCDASGLRAAWTFEEEAGPVLDCTGHLFHADLFGDAGREPGRKGGFAFSTRNEGPGTDYAQIRNPTALLPAGPFTIAAWTLYRDASRNGRILASSNFNVDRGLELTFEGGSSSGVDGRPNYLAFIFGIDAEGGASPGDDVVVDTHGGLRPGEWHHVTALYDGSTIAIFLDGVEEMRKVAPKRRIATQPFYIGRRTDCCFHDGMIDDLRVYERALPSDEIRALAAP